MAVRTITVTADAYDRLARLKKPGESFSHLLKRLIPETTVRDLVGIMSPEMGDFVAKAVKKGRKEFDEDFRRRQGRIRRGLEGKD